MVRKGQAAMEYLMTYGWAILVIVIVLAALLYLGVFNVGERIPEQCNFRVGIMCTSAKLTATDLTLTLRNGLGNKVTVCAITCDDSLEAGDVTAIAVSTCQTTNLGTIDVGEEDTFAAGNGCTEDGTTYLSDVGERYRGKLFLQYYVKDDAGTDNARLAEGDLQAVIQP